MLSVYIIKDKETQDFYSKRQNYPRRKITVFIIYQCFILHFYKVSFLFGLKELNFYASNKFVCHSLRNLAYLSKLFFIEFSVFDNAMCIIYLRSYSFIGLLSKEL